MDRGERKRAIDILEDGLATTKGQLESLERGSILYELGHCLYGEKENKEAIVCFEEALKIRQTKLGDCEQVLDTLITIGKVYKAVGLDGDNLKVCRQVLEITEKIYSGNDEKTASALFSVGEALETLELYGEAVATYSECKELLKRAFCGDHLDVAKVLARLGKVHASHKGFDNAHACYLEALKIRQANLEPDHPLLAETLYGIGVVAREIEEYNNARDYLQDALRIQKQLELAHETCITLIELGNVFRSMYDPQSAVECYERCISIINPDTSEPSLFSKVYLALGHAKLNNNQILEAMECYDHGKAATHTMTGCAFECILTIVVLFFQH
jgi:tetratricopeptide (TPR) repeat protein